MKRLMISVAVLALSLPILAIAQDTSKQNDNQASQSQQTQSQTNANTGNKNMSGKVSSKGKNFTNDADNKKYKVDNPNALKDYEDQDVAVIVHVDPDTGDLHIIQVEPPKQ